MHPHHCLTKTTPMRKLACSAVFIMLCLCFSLTCMAKEQPDTVTTGIYVTSIHDIDFKQKEYAITFWLWLKYKNKDFSFDKYLEVPQAKSVDKSFFTIDSSGDRIYMLMKLQCVMKDSWKIDNFPFDVQKLRLSIENSQFDDRSLVFVPDTLGEHYDKRFTLRGWTIDSFVLSTNKRVYETGFGDETLAKPRTEYSAFRARISISRDSAGLFWKMFTGMYIAFLIAFVCFYIHADSIDSRFGLSVGALFAVIGNKYIIDSALPESTTFTLVDTLHGITLLFIFGIITATIYSLRLVKANKHDKAARFDNRCGKIVLILYLAANLCFIFMAKK